MIDSQEIIERSFYSALLNTSISLGYSLNPEDYLPVSSENEQRFKQDMRNLSKYIPIFGTANATSKDQKTTPRIVINARGFYPGGIGMPRQLIEKQEGIGFTATEVPYESLDQYIDVHLVANNQEDLRLLHQILFWSIPQRGYIKPYTADSFLFTGNIFEEVVNFYDSPNLNLGLLEKVYQFQVMDTLVGAREPGEADLVPIVTIELLMKQYGYQEYQNELIVKS